MLKLQGIFSPVTTPFDHAGEIYKTKVRHNFEKWNQVKLAGYVVGGSTGEGAMLDAEEKIALWGMAAEAAAPDRLLIAACGAESVRETVSLANKAAGIGYKAAAVITPHRYGNISRNAETQELYFNAVADGSRIPVMIFNSPELTGVDLSAESVARLSQHPNIVAINEGAGNLEKVLRMLREAKKGFQVLVGSASTLWPSLHVGAAGGVLAFANAAPYACITIWEAHRTREQEAALDWQHKIGHASHLVTARYGIPGLKYAMDLGGYYGGPCRLPLRPLTPVAKREIEEAFADLRG